MGWVSRTPVAHECHPPQKYSRRNGVGSIWECRCGQRWRLTKWQLTYAGEHATWEKTR